MNNMRVWDLLKYTYKAIYYRLEQRRLNTGATVIVKTTKGRVKGAIRLSVWGKAYYSFEGIPYAEPPLGELRFRAPVVKDAWPEILDCTDPGEIPMQGNIFFRKYKGSEDCLYLNVFTNEVAASKGRPVMVWIYGGGFQMGEATRDLYSPDYFMSKDVVLVTIAYRLGPFGFLSLDDPSIDVPGNAGIKDQILALKWVQENISAFGGDPNNVTLFGESAGGASTHLCMLSENCKGLIHKAIVMSGSILCPWVIPPPNKWAYRLAVALGYQDEEKPQKIYKFLMNIPAPDIQKAVGLVLNKKEKHNRVMVAFGPVIEPYSTPQGVLLQQPIEVLQKSWSNDIPLLIGGTSFEGLLFYPEVMRRKATLDEVGNCENLLPAELKSDSNPSQDVKQMGLRLKLAYFGEEECNLKNVMKFLEVESYREFWHPIYRTCLARIKYAQAPTYLYRFDFDSKDGNGVRNILCGPELRGACHGDDLCYIFRMIFSYKVNEHTSEYRISQAMIDIWTNFASRGDPNCQSLAGVKFEPLAKDKELKCLNISSKIDYMRLPELSKMHVWDSFYPPDIL